MAFAILEANPRHHYRVGGFIRFFRHFFFFNFSIRDFLFAVDLRLKAITKPLPQYILTKAQYLDTQKSQFCQKIIAIISLAFAVCAIFFHLFVIRDLRFLYLC